MLSGDIETNPGPAGRPADYFPCGYCQLDVSWGCNGGVACDTCKIWYHISCHEINMSRYQRMQDPEVNWKCYKCSSAFSDIYQPLYSSQCISAQHITSSIVTLNLSNESPVTFRHNTASTPIVKGGSIATHTPSSGSLHSAPSALYGSYILSHGSPSTPDVSDLNSKAKTAGVQSY